MTILNFKYIPGDKNELSHLLALKEFFLEDVWSEQKSWNKAKSYEKYGLPGWRYEMIRRSAGLELAHTNLSEANLAITYHPDSNR